MLILTIFLGFMLNYTAWGRHLYAIGSNENAAIMTGVRESCENVCISFLQSDSRYVSNNDCWLDGSVTNALGMIYELRVIASAVIGGADLMGELALLMGH